MKIQVLTLTFIWLSAVLQLPVHSYGQEQASDADRLRIRMDDIFESAVEVTDEVDRICPPKTCILIGVGGSPGMVTTIRNARHPHSATTLPLSFFKNYDINSDQRRDLFAHFDQYVPDLKRRQAKKVMIIDYSDTGSTLKATGQALEDYFAHKNWEFDPELITLNDSDRAPRVRLNLKDSGFQFHMVERKVGHPYMDSMANANLKKYTQYQKFPFINGARQVQTNQESFNLLEQEVQRRLESRGLPITPRGPACVKGVLNGLRVF